MRGGRTIYTRLERHGMTPDGVEIMQRAFRSNIENSLGTEIRLSDGLAWADLQEIATVSGTDGMLLGRCKAAAASIRYHFLCLLENACNPYAFPL